MTFWPLTLFFLAAHLIPSLTALSVSWNADKHPTHTLDHVTAILQGGSGDLSKVNVVLFIRNQRTGEEANIPIANNVENTGSYTIQVPNKYIGNPGSTAIDDYFRNDLRYQTRALNLSNNQVIGQSDEFIIFWSSSDGTPTPSPLSSAAPAPPASPSPSTSSSSNQSNGDQNKKSDSNSSSSQGSNGSAKTTTQPTATSGSSSSLSAVTGVSSNTATPAFISTSSGAAFAVTVQGQAINGSTSTVTSVIAGATQSKSSNEHTDHTGAIVGAIIGGLLFLMLIGWVGIWWCRRRRFKDSSVRPDPFSSPPVRVNIRVQRSTSGFVTLADDRSSTFAQDSPTLSRRPSGYSIHSYAPRTISSSGNLSYTGDYSSSPPSRQGSTSSRRSAPRPLPSLPSLPVSSVLSSQSSINDDTWMTARTTPDYLSVLSTRDTYDIPEFPPPEYDESGSGNMTEIGSGRASFISVDSRATLANLA